MTLPKKPLAATIAASALALVAALSLNATNASAVPAPVASAQPEVVPNETILTFEDSSVAERVLASAERSDGLTAEVVADDLGGRMVITVTADSPEKAEALIGAAEALPGVSAQPNYVYRLIDGETEPIDADGVDALAADPLALPTKFPADKLARLQYYLMDIGNGSTQSGSNIFAAWDLVQSQTDHADVTVAVIDSGINTQHEDLQEHIDLDHAYSPYTDDGQVEDQIGHGTSVTGLIAATANNEKGIAGIASTGIGDHVSVVPLKIFADTGETETSVIVQALDHLDGLVEDGMLDDLRVVNMSLGFYREDDNPSDSAMLDAIDHLVQDHDVLVVASGGNGDENQHAMTMPIYPSDDDLCLSVTSLTETGANSEFSDYNLHKDIAAPGEMIATTDVGSSDAYAYEAGTSFSAPITSGVAALMFSVDPTLTPADAIEIIKTTAAPLPDTSINDWGDETGCAGALDAGAALKAVIERTGGTVPTEGTAIYRLYNPDTTEHLLSTDRNEYDVLGTLGWNREGIAWRAPSEDAEVEGLVAIHRLYNPSNGDHLYTADEVERDVLCAAGWSDEGLNQWGVADGGLPIYRLFNPTHTDNDGAFAHLWTADENEYAQLAKQGWVQEGVAWRALG